MNYGYVKVAAAVPRVKVADCKFNASEIEKEIIIADGKGVQIIAFPRVVHYRIYLWRPLCPATSARRGRNGIDTDSEQYAPDGYYLDIGHARRTERRVAECGGCHPERESAGRCPEDLSSQL